MKRRETSLTGWLALQRLEGSPIEVYYVRLHHGGNGWTLGETHVSCRFPSREMDSSETMCRNALNARTLATRRDYSSEYLGSDTLTRMGRRNRINTPSSQTYTTRLQKGGALFDDMRLLVRQWSDAIGDDQRDSMVVENLLGKNTRARAADIYRRAFLPRFIAGDPPDAWRIAQALEREEPAIDFLRPLYYWVTARGERLLYDYVCEDLFTQSRAGTQVVDIAEVKNWITQQIARIGKEWTPTVTTKVAQAILATLRDFGILEGAIKKRIAPSYLPTESFVYIAFALHSLGSSGAQLVKHPDWRLFLFFPENVERMFLEADRSGFLNYQSAGEIVRIEFFEHTFEETAHVLASTAV